jgi:cupin fold WbuC family metalloprotein
MPVIDNPSGEVIFTEERIVKLSRFDVSSLKDLADSNGKGSVRLCAHPSIEDELHEMFIVHPIDTYVRPHKHLTKSISFHVLEGLADFVIFDEEGKIIDVIPVGGYTSGQRFYCRVPNSQYYTQLIRSDVFVFHETIVGPFDRSDTIWAPWSPERNDHDNAEKFMDQMVRAVDKFPSDPVN